MKYRLLKAALMLSMAGYLFIHGTTATYAMQMEAVAEPEQIEEQGPDDDELAFVEEIEEAEEQNPVKKYIVIAIGTTFGLMIVISVAIKISRSAEERRSKERIKKENEKIKKKRALENEELTNLISSYEDEYEDMDKKVKRLEQSQNHQGAEKKEQKKFAQISQATLDAVKEPEELEAEKVAAAQMAMLQQPVYPTPVVVPAQPVYPGQPMMQPVYPTQPVYTQPVQPMMQPVYPTQPVQPMMQPVYPAQPMYQTVPQTPPTQPQSSPAETKQAKEKRIPAYARKDN